MSYSVPCSTLSYVPSFAHLLKYSAGLALAFSLSNSSASMMGCAQVIRSKRMGKMYICRYRIGINHHHHHVCMYVCIHVCMYVCMCVCMYTMYVCTMYVLCMYVCMYVCMYGGGYVCTCVRAYIVHK